MSPSRLTSAVACCTSLLGLQCSPLVHSPSTTQRRNPSISLSKSSRSFLSSPIPSSYRPRATLLPYFSCHNPPFLYSPSFFPSTLRVLSFLTSFFFCLCLLRCASVLCVPCQPSLPSWLLITAADRFPLNQNITSFAGGFARQSRKYNPLPTRFQHLSIVTTLERIIVNPVRLSIPQDKRKPPNKLKKKNQQDYTNHPRSSGRLNLYISTPNSCTVFIISTSASVIRFTLHSIALLAPSHILVSILQPLICNRVVVDRQTTESRNKPTRKQREKSDRQS